MLLQNATNYASNPITLTGGTLAGESIYLGLRDQTFLAFAGSVAGNAAVPVGYTPGDAWLPAIKPGGMGAGSQSDIAGTATLAAGRNAEATSSITLDGVASMVGVANMAASANIALTIVADATSTSSMESSSAMTLSSSANLAAAAAAIASSSMTMTGSADITLAPSPMVASSSMTMTGACEAIGAATLTATSSIALASDATIRADGFIAASSTSTLTTTASQGALAFMVAAAGGPESLSPEGLAAAVWRSLATSYNTDGTMGAKLNAASSAGDPWGTVVPGSYPVGSAGWLIGQLAIENPDIATQLDDVWKRLGLDPANPQVSTEDYISSGPVILEVTRDSSSTTVTRVI